MTETWAAVLCAVFGALYVLSMGVLQSRLSALYRAREREPQAPRLLSSNPLVNLRALAFIYSFSSRDLQDFAATVSLNLARVAFPMAIVLGALAMNLSLTR